MPAPKRYATRRNITVETAVGILALVGVLGWIIALQVQTSLLDASATSQDTVNMQVESKIMQLEILANSSDMPGFLLKTPATPSRTILPGTLALPAVNQRYAIQSIRNFSDAIVLWDDADYFNIATPTVITVMSDGRYEFALTLYSTLSTQLPDIFETYDIWYDVRLQVNAIVTEVRFKYEFSPAGARGLSPQTASGVNSGMLSAGDTFQVTEIVRIKQTTGAPGPIGFNIVTVFDEFTVAIMKLSEPPPP